MRNHPVCVIWIGCDCEVVSLTNWWWKGVHSKDRVRGILKKKREYQPRPSGYPKVVVLSEVTRKAFVRCNLGRTCNDCGSPFTDENAEIWLAFETKHSDPMYFCAECVKKRGEKQDMEEKVNDKAVRNERRNRMIYRQGDVLIERVSSIPTEGKKVAPKGGRIILAEGEATGHHHSLAVTDVETAILEQDGGAMFLELIRDSVVTHQEHASINLDAGTYRVTRQREYSPEQIRNVAD